MTHLQRAALLIGGVMSLVFAGACGGSDHITGPSGKGYLELAITPPNGRTDGIALLLITGAVVDTFKSSGTGFTARTIGARTSQAHVLVRGVLSGKTTIGRICVSNVENDNDYSVQVLQVAGGAAAGYAKRPDLGDYVWTKTPVTGDC